MGDGLPENLCKIKYQHYEKRRKIRLKQVQEFIIATRKNKQSSIVNQLSKESFIELKKSKSNMMRIASP